MKTGSTTTTVTERKKMSDDDSVERRREEARMKELLRIDHQDEERRRGEGVQQVGRPSEGPSAQDDGHHHRGTHRGRLPSSGRSVEPQHGHEEPAAEAPRYSQESQDRQGNGANEVNVQTGDRKHMHGAGFHEWIFDLIGESGFPSQGHGLE